MSMDSSTKPSIERDGHAVDYNQRFIYLVEIKIYFSCLYLCKR